MYEKEKFLYSWKRRLTELKKCDSYQLYKVIFEQEKYLSVLLSNFAISLCKFCASSHKLEIEILGHVRPLIPSIEKSVRDVNQTRQVTNTIIY